MAQLTAADITKLCDDWCDASRAPEGIVLSANTEKFRLIKNGVEFHELDHKAICASLTGLSKTLLLPMRNSIITSDHFFLWSWCGELLLNPIAYPYFPIEQHEIRSLYEAALRASLVHCKRSSTNYEEDVKQDRIQNLRAHHATQFAMKSDLILGYLVFPLLESVLKRACSNYISGDGKVVSSFSVPTKKGNPARSYKPNQQCNSLRDLLFLHHTCVAGAELKPFVDCFREYIATLDQTKDPFDLIYSWRNQSLHGESNFKSIGGTILNFALLISLFEIEQSFDKRRAQVIEQYRQEARFQEKSPWSFYPPY